MNKYYFAILLILSCSSPPPPETKLPPVPAAVIEEVKSPVKVTVEYVIKVMTICNAKGSPPVLRSKATLFANIIPTYIRNTADQEMYVLLICIESKFDNKARSSVGAVGYAQIMPKYAQSFADLCNLGQLGKDDETDPILNLSLGACLFQHLLDTHKSNILALAAYNAGSASSSVASLKQLGNPVPETAAYVAKATYLKEKVEGKERD